MRAKNTQDKHDGRSGEHHAADALPFPSHRKALLKLHAAGTIEQYWSAAQALIEGVAPCSTRWFCVRPLRMATALLLLREKPVARGRLRAAPSEEESALLQDLFARHPAMPHFRRAGRQPLVHLKIAPPETGSQAGQDLLREHRWEHGVALAFRKQKRLEGILLLHRSRQEGDFSGLELTRLRNLHDHLETALCRLISARGNQAEKIVLANILRPLPLPLVLCDATLQIVCESVAGLAARTRWESGDERTRVQNLSSRRPLPRDLACFCEERNEAWKKAGPAQRLSLEKKEYRLAHASAPQLVARVRMIRLGFFPLVPPLLLIQFEPGVAAEVESGPWNQKFAVLSRLSARERELALLVCRGHTNERIARELGKSVHTIKTQLNSIFDKLQVKRRSQLIALLFRSAKSSGGEWGTHCQDGVGERTTFEAVLRAAES